MVAHGPGAAGSNAAAESGTDAESDADVDSGADVGSGAAAVRRRMSARIAFITDLA